MMRIPSEAFVQAELAYRASLSGPGRHRGTRGESGSTVGRHRGLRARRRHVVATMGASVSPASTTASTQRTLAPGATATIVDLRRAGRRPGEAA